MVLVVIRRIMVDPIYQLIKQAEKSTTSVRLHYLTRVIIRQMKYVVLVMFNLLATRLILREFVVAISLITQKKIDNVLVIFCATVEPYGMKIVGWYSLAEVFRKCQTLEFYDADSCLESEDVYFFRATISNCVLLPIKERESYSSKWSVPNATKDDIGFGRSNVWYADTIEAQDYVQKIVKQINEYDGENLIDEFLSED